MKKVRKRMSEKEKRHPQFVKVDQDLFYQKLRNLREKDLSESWVLECMVMGALRESTQNS